MPTPASTRSSTNWRPHFDQPERTRRRPARGRALCCKRPPPRPGDWRSLFRTAPQSKRCRTVWQHRIRPVDTQSTRDECVLSESMYHSLISLECADVSRKVILNAEAEVDVFNSADACKCFMSVPVALRGFHNNIDLLNASNVALAFRIRRKMFSTECVFYIQKYAMRN